MGLILPQITEVLIESNNKNYYLNKGYEIPTYKNDRGKYVTKRGSKILVHVLDLSDGCSFKVKVQCDKCGDTYEMAYRDYVSNYYVKKQDRLLCFTCINPSMLNCKINTEQRWGNREYALLRLKRYIQFYGNLYDWTMTQEGLIINNRLKSHGYNLTNMCLELGYDYSKLINKKYGDVGSNYTKLKNAISNYIDEYGFFPSLKTLKYDFGIPNTIIQKYGGITKIKKDLAYTNNEYVDDNGFYNSSHYEYMVAQFLIHNNITYKREQHPFPKPNHNLRSDFTFFKTDGSEIHLEVWGYLEEDADGIRSKTYCERKSDKIKLYSKYNIPLIEIEPTIFSNTFEKIQECLSNIFSNVFTIELKTISNQYMVNPNKMSDYELFLEIIKLSVDGITLPKESYYSSDNKCLFYEALKRFGNYNKFAKHFGVVTNSKVGYWNKDTVLTRMIDIHSKYGHMPTSGYLKLHRREDSLFCGLLDAIKNNYDSTVDAYVSLFENRVNLNVKLGESDVNYLKNIINKQYFHSSLLTENITKRAENILKMIDV